jgi:2,3-bisphosphoglycerate-dependent phosphoglycerate mutase
MQLYLIRHAQSENNAKPEDQRVPDPGITELGRRQAAEVARRFRTIRLTHLVTSPFRRALETTEYLRCQVGLMPEIWTPLHEHGGCYRGYVPGDMVGQPGMTEREITAAFPGYKIDPAIGEAGWWSSKPHESAEQAMLRARKLIPDMMQRFGSPENVVAFVMHADFKRLLIEQLLTNSSDGAAYDANAPIYNTAVTRLHISFSDIRLDLYNCVEHLSEAMLSA